jgi:hypothetical protein
VSPEGENETILGLLEQPIYEACWARRSPGKVEQKDREDPEEDRFNLLLEGEIKT